jgi:2'-5' RNA ligase
MSRIRSFIALPSPPSVKDEAARILAELQPIDADVRWESLEKLHITLKFLGNVESQLLENLIPALEEIAREQPSFEITYEGVGAFPTLTAPRVIWIGTAQTASLHALQNAVEQRCVEFGIARESREFHPHLTIGRVKSSRNIQRLTEKLKTLTLEPRRTRCTELLVMKSDLTPRGSVYSVLKSIPFKP